jgi:hypothetical protein
MIRRPAEVASVVTAAIIVEEEGHDGILGLWMVVAVTFGGSRIYPVIHNEDDRPCR